MTPVLAGWQQVVALFERREQVLVWLPRAVQLVGQQALLVELAVQEELR